MYNVKGDVGFVWRPIFPVLCLCKASKRQGHTFIETEIGPARIILIWIYSWLALPLLNHSLSSSNGPWAHSGKVSECPWCMFVTCFKIESHVGGEQRLLTGRSILSISVKYLGGKPFKTL